MELFFLLLAQVVPICFYLTFLILLLVRVNPKVSDVYLFSLLFALMTVSFIADIVYILISDEVSLSYIQDISLYKIYIISSLLPFAMLKYFFNFYKYGKYLYVSICVLGLLMGCINHVGLMEPSLQPTVLLKRLAIGFNAVVLSIFLYLVILRRDGNSDIVLLKMTKKLRVYMVYYTSLTNMFVYYLLTDGRLIDYILTLTGFMILHGVMALFRLNTDRPRKSVPYPVPDEQETEMVPVFEDSDSKYRISYTDTRVDIDDMKDRILDYLDKKRMFLHPNLTIDKMATDLYTNKTYLSKVINNEMHKGFRELINYYRVKEAMRIYNETQDISVDELSMLCGFNNMASLTNAFKFNTGKTPGEWCRDIKRKLNDDNYGKGNIE